jgi:hypothetical protein
MKMFRQGIWGHGLYRDQCDNGPSSRVSDGLKNISSCFHFFVICNYSIANINATI